jgi:hypothetical protein
MSEEHKVRYITTFHTDVSPPLDPERAPILDAFWRGDQEAFEALLSAEGKADVKPRGESELLFEFLAAIRSGLQNSHDGEESTNTKIVSAQRLMLSAFLKQRPSCIQAFRPVQGNFVHTVFNAALLTGDLDTVRLVQAAGASPSVRTQKFEVEGVEKFPDCTPMYLMDSGVSIRLVEALIPELLRDWQSTFDVKNKAALGGLLGRCACEWISTGSDDCFIRWQKARRILEGGFNLLLGPDGETSIFCDEKCLAQTQKPENWFRSCGVVELALKTRCHVPLALILSLLTICKNEEDMMPLLRAGLEHCKDFFQPPKINEQPGLIMISEFARRNWANALKSAVVACSEANQRRSFDVFTTMEDKVGTAAQHAARLKNVEALEVLLEFSDVDVIGSFEGSLNRGEEAILPVVKLVTEGGAVFEGPICEKVMTLAAKQQAELQSG